MSQKPDLAKRGVWRKRLREFERGGERIVDFCRRLGVPVWSFYYWRQRLRSDAVTASGPQRRGTAAAAAARHARLARRASRVGTKPRMKFVPVHITGPSGVEVHFPNGTRLTVPGRDHDAIGAVIAALVSEPPERRPC